MGRQTLNINFYCRESKANKHGLSPIEISVIINGKRTYIALQRKAKPDEFSSCMASKKDNAIKQYCETVRRKLDDIIEELMDNDIELTAANLKEYYSRGGVSKIYTVNDMISEYLDIQHRKIGKAIIEETYNRYVEARDKFYELLELTGEEPAKSFTHQDILTFQAALLNCYKQDTAAHYLGRVKSFFKYGFEAGKVPSFAFNSIKITKEKNKKIIFLTEDEIEAIRNKNYHSMRLYNVSRLFLFQCFTGLSYADMALLTREDFQKNKYGQIYITKARKKTGVEFTTVLLSDAVNIAEEYNYHLPLLSNQKYDSYLKEIADLCGITKNLTSHVARHTCATYLLNNLKTENAMEIVQKVMGHNDPKVTRKYYAALFDSTVFETISKLPGHKTIEDIKVTPETDFKDTSLPIEERFERFTLWINGVPVAPRRNSLSRRERRGLSEIK